MDNTLTTLLKLTSPISRQINIIYFLLWYTEEELPVFPLVFLPKMYKLNVIMKKY